MNNEKKIRILLKPFAVFWWATVLSGPFMASASFAQTGNEYPQRPIRIIVSFAPGGGTDIIGRALTTKLSEILKQSVYIENKVGASGNIGTQYVANAAPDGYTYLLTSSAYVVNYSFQRGSAGYDPVKDFMPVVIAASQPMAIVVNDKFLRAQERHRKLPATDYSMGFGKVMPCISLIRGRPQPWLRWLAVKSPSFAVRWAQ